MASENIVVGGITVKGSFLLRDIYKAVLEMNESKDNPVFRFPIGKGITDKGKEKTYFASVTIDGKANNKQEGLNVLAKLGSALVDVRLPVIPDGTTLQFRLKPAMKANFVVCLLAYVGGLDIPDIVPMESRKEAFGKMNLLVNEPSANPPANPPTEPADNRGIGSASETGTVLEPVAR